MPTDASPPPEPDDGAPDAEETPAVIEVGAAPHRGTTTARRASSAKWVMAFLGLAVIIVLQVVILQRLGTTETELTEVRGDVSGLTADVRTANDRIDAVSDDVATIGAGATPAQTQTAAVADGSLPMFSDPQTDAAVLGEYVLGEVSGVEYYSSQATTIVPNDGKARVWLVWAHWCPYCQQELPELAQWYPENADRFPNTELVTITTSMDETRGNPLVPYLEDSQFPFPVLVDEDLTLAGQLGTSAFPFWVVTDPEGTVVFRVAGAIGVDAMEAIFSQIDTLSQS